jgi:excisionase family DNA binding protein
MGRLRKDFPMTETFNSFCLINHTLAHAPPPSAGAAGTAAAIDRTGEAAAPAAGPAVFHTVEEVALAVGVCTRTVGRWIRDGVLRKAPLGGRTVRISSTELQRLAAAR